MKACPTGSIMFGSKESMIQQAEDRIVDLKDRGYKNAGLYNPAGVGGTHVMYVLHHADRPGLYHKLAADPSISPLVGLWKGITKPLMSLGIGLAVLGGFFHYVTRGPQEIRRDTDSDESDKGDHG